MKNGTKEKFRYAVADLIGENWQDILGVIAVLVSLIIIVKQDIDPTLKILDAILVVIFIIASRLMLMGLQQNKILRLLEKGAVPPSVGSVFTTKLEWPEDLCVGATNVVVVGRSLRKTLDDEFSKLSEALRESATVTIAITDPRNTTALERLVRAYGERYTAKGHKTRLEATIDTTRALMHIPRAGGTLSLRLSHRVVEIGGVVVERPWGGVCGIEQYLKTDPQKPDRHTCFWISEKDEPELYAYYLEHLEETANEGEPFDLNDPD